MPKCKTCKVDKPQGAFYLRKETGRYRPTCKVCFSDMVAVRQRGMSLSDLRILEHASGNRCQICGIHQSELKEGRVTRLCLDHCHTKGPVRGLLCGPCNQAIGLMEDDPMRLRQAAAYLEGERPFTPKVILET